MKIFSGNQIKSWDKYTIQEEPIPSFELMERAAGTFCSWFIETYPNRQHHISIFCGIGNNGGDGLVVSRYLLNEKYSVTTYIIEYSNAYSSDFKIELKKLEELSNADIVYISGDQDPIELGDTEMIIDAIFGSGLDRPIAGFTKKIIQTLNTSKKRIISIDISSGLSCDAMISGPKVKPHTTFSFQLPKLSFFLPQNDSYVGEIVLGDIGLHDQYYNDTEADCHLYTILEAKKAMIRRSRYIHKGTNGHSLIVAGSYGKMGAAVLSAKAALTAGSGLVTAHVPSCGVSVLQTAVPEAMVSSDCSEQYISNSIPVEKNYQALGIGPGLGQSKETIQAVVETISNSSIPLVVDADALNCLVLSGDFSVLPPNSILTPHPGEFNRMVGHWDNDYERLEKVKQFATTYQVIVILKGAYTTIAFPNGTIWFNSSGNPALATAGSGDVLTGIITGLLAQGYLPEDASRLGVFIHGLSADIYQEAVSSQRMIARDIIQYMGHAFERILHST